MKANKNNSHYVEEEKGVEGGTVEQVLPVAATHLSAGADLRQVEEKVG